MNIRHRGPLGASAPRLVSAVLSSVLLATLGTSALMAQTAPPASPLDKPVFEALDKYQKGDAAGALAILEPHRKEVLGIPPLLNLLATLYVEGGKPQEADALLAPLAAKEDADPAILYNAGRAAAALGRTAEAQKLYERSVAKEAASPASRELGLLLARQGQVVEAYRRLRPWAIRSPRDVEARTTAAILALQLERPWEADQMLEGLPATDGALILLRAQSAVQKGEGKSALTILSPIAESHPPAIDLEVRKTLAEAHLANNDPARAASALAGKTAGIPALSLVLARAQRLSGDTAAARATLEPFIAKLPPPEIAAQEIGDPRPAAGIALEWGRLLLAANSGANAAEAIRFFETATRLDPNRAESFQSLGEAQTAAGNPTAGAASIARAKELADSQAEVRAEWKAFAQAEAKATAEVRAAATNPTTNPPANAKPAVPISPEMQDALRAMAAGKSDDAVAALRRQIKAVPDDHAARSMEITVLLQQSRLQEALSSAEAARRHDPERADASYQLGVVHMAMKNFDQAEKDLREALRKQPNHIAAMSDLAVLLSDRGGRDEAVQLLEKVLALEPNNPGARINLDAIKKP